MDLAGQGLILMVRCGYRPCGMVKHGFFLLLLALHRMVPRLLYVDNVVQ